MKFLPIVAVALLASSLPAQTYRRQAAITGGGGDRGRCVVEIVVDGAAEVAIRADDATVTNLKGAPPEIRRFECTSPLPGNAREFHYAPLGGRGRQELLRPAAEGQPAVVRIEDPQNGADRYVFEITWHAELGGERREERHRLSTDEAIEACRREVRHRLVDRFRPDDINFREIRVDAAPGRGEWIVGILDAGRDRRGEAMRFSCHVNFETGEVREAQLEPLRRDR